MGRCGAARPGPRRGGPGDPDGHAGSPGTRPPPGIRHRPPALPSGKPDGAQTGKWTRLRRGLGDDE